MRTKVRRIFACALAAGALVSMSAFAATASASSSLSMVATAYGPTAQDNYPYGPTDYFGQPLTAGDVAVDPSVIPLGTCLYITGYSSPYLPKGGFYGEADDTGGAIKGDRVDLYYSGTEPQINQFGIQDVKVTILGKSPDAPSQASGTRACASFEPASGQAGGSAAQGAGGAAATSAQGRPAAQSVKGNRGRARGTRRWRDRDGRHWRSAALGLRFR